MKKELTERCVPDRVILTVGNVHLNHVNECYWNCGRLSCVVRHLPSECRENPYKRAVWVDKVSIYIKLHQYVKKTDTEEEGKKGQISIRSN